MQTAGSAKEIMTFLYFPEEDRVIFSALFSPAQKRQYAISNAMDWFKSSNFVHKDDRKTFLHMLNAEKQGAAWVENTLRFLVGEERYEWLELYVNRDSGVSGGRAWSPVF